MQSAKSTGPIGPKGPSTSTIHGRTMYNVDGYKRATCGADALRTSAAALLQRGRHLHCGCGGGAREAGDTVKCRTGTLPSRSGCAKQYPSTRTGPPSAPPPRASRHPSAPPARSLLHISLLTRASDKSPLPLHARSYTQRHAHVHSHLHLPSRPRQPLLSLEGPALSLDSTRGWDWTLSS
jgi:hypothetical protein